MEAAKFGLLVQVSLTLIFSVSAQTSCPSLSFRTGVDIQCMHPASKESMNCQKMRMPVGTIAKYGCEEFFVTNDGETEGGLMTCSSSGKWTPDLRFRSFSCHMDCGKSYPDSAHTFWPWHVGIFARESRSAPANFEFACGGTLINPFNADELLVLTGADCIRNRNAEDIEIRLGLFTHEKNSDQKSTGQTLPARKIVTEDDGLLALIQLSGEPTLSKSVLPACMSLSVDFTKHQLQEGVFGQLVGFGDKSENEALRNISAGVVPIGNCIDKRARIISKHSFCAGGGQEGRNICNGDSGSGLLFPRFYASSERHFILGVLGERLRSCKSHSWFIGVSDYADWIKQTALELHEDRNSQKDGLVKPKPTKISKTLPPVTHRFQRIQTTLPPRTVPTTLPPRTVSPRFQTVPTIVSPRFQTQPPISIEEVDSEGFDDLDTLPIPISKIIKKIIKSKEPTSVSVEAIDDNSAFSTSMKDYEAAGVTQHNLFRRKHGAPPVKLSAQLSQSAQFEAEQALATNRFKFEGFTNWYGMSGRTVPFPRLVQDAVRDWYKTGASYNWSHPRANPFTQIVWRRTTAIGVGVATRGRKQIVVVKYSRPNVNPAEREKAFRENVLPSS